MKHRRLFWLLVVVAVFSTMAEPVTSQPTDKMVKFYCSRYRRMNAWSFWSNLNATTSSLRQQLSVSRFGADRKLFNDDPVWGLAWCRGYVSIPDCLDCFDYAVAQLKTCGIANGAYATYSNCDFRFENYNFFTEVNNPAGLASCGGIPSPQSTEFTKIAKRLINDLQIATPRTPNLYATSISQEPGANTTLYGLAQCNIKLSQSACLECLKLRSKSLYDCLPSTSGQATNIGCFMKYSRTPFFGQNQTTDITSLLGNGDSYKKKSIIGGVLGVVCFLLLVLSFLLWRPKSKMKGRVQQDISTGSTELLQGPAEYSYNDLRVATSNFSHENKLGGGVFGEVYKGTLKDGSTVAIKKIFVASSRGDKSFNDEIKIINNVHHRHILRILGYCSKGPHLFLVHEYMENGSLDQVLYGNKRRILNWKQRFDIIYGTARGLAYLHKQYHVTIIHSNIKPSNILLDSEFQPKIADFGLARLLPEDKTHISTKFSGSLNNGYIAPEYVIHGKLSEKVDTYSFGVVVLEILSGKRYMDVTDHQQVTQNLLDQAWNLYEGGMQLNLMDEKLDPSEYASEDAEKIIKIALMCIQSPSARPAMSEVVMLLSEKSLNRSTPARSTILDDEVKIEVDTMKLLSSNTYKLYGF